ncbi:hypothetical protein [Effusibacillus consociatus]|uniref:SIS domain-containing protein n=1 Tax=Effusibacillus consociatus TaxID=1117041 RepID=A0ABV9PYR6_9BACL
MNKQKVVKQQMLEELASVFYSIGDAEIEGLVNEIVRAKKVFIYGLGRERLMMEMVVILLKEKLNQTEANMEKRHTNLE